MENLEKRISVMQPYIFPYIGYFQLINAVDEFVFYDDVNFIKQGWINRNYILLNNKPHLFTIPLKKASPFKTIKETEINEDLFGIWKKKFIMTVRQTYKKAPYYNRTSQLIEEVFEQEVKSIAEMAIYSIITTSKYINLNTHFHTSSYDFAQTKGLGRSDRLINISKSLDGSHYLNSSGGEKLYDKCYFLKYGIKLHFLKPKIKEYKQFSTGFNPNLSIIDLMMFLNTEDLVYHLNSYDVI